MVGEIVFFISRSSTFDIFFTYELLVFLKKIFILTTYILFIIHFLADRADDRLIFYKFGELC